MSLVDRIVRTVTERSRLVVVLMLVLTLVVGPGALFVEDSSQVALADDSDVAAANEFVAETFGERGPNTTTAVVAIEHGITSESLRRELAYQRALVTNESVNRTLVEDQSFGIATIVATTAIREGQNAGQGGTAPSLARQIEQLESMSDGEVASTVRAIADPDGDHPRQRVVQQLLGRGYEPGSENTTSRMLPLTFETAEPVQLEAEVSTAVTESQLAARAIARETSGPESYRMIGSGLVGDREEAAIEGSLGLVGPLAFLFVLVAFSLAYRDPLDIILGMFGVGVVLVCTIGVIGWAGVAFNQTLIAVPILLIGLSVDYAFHVLMRYREERDTDPGGTAPSNQTRNTRTPTEESQHEERRDEEHRTGGDRRNGVTAVRPGMARALRGVGPALVLVTVTTAIGFLANLISPVSDLRTFGVVAAVGIVATLFVFGLLVPALKVELDAALERRGWDRRGRAFGTSGRLKRVLSRSSHLAGRLPVAVLVVTLLLTAGGLVATTGLETSANTNAFLADEPPEWTEHLPEAMQPGEFYLKENRERIYSQFQTPNQYGEVLIRGTATDPETLRQLAAGERVAANSSVTVNRSTGEPAVTSPLSAMERTAAINDTFNRTFTAADTTGDGIPDENIGRVYDAFVEANPTLATRYVHRADGEADALRLSIGVDGTAAPTTVEDEVSAVATTIDTADGQEVIATGQPLVTATVIGQLTSTIVWGIAVTVVTILVLLGAVFRRTDGSALLGLLTFFPVVCALVWLLATLVVLDIPVGQITAMVGSISLGLGVDYTIHVTKRYTEELATHGDPAAALRRTVLGTGGALLSSATTTAAGFGVLTFALLPALRQFGLSLALGIVYAFVASVVVLPSLLVLWTRYSLD